MIELHHGDCLDILPMLPDNSVDMVFVDLPYGTTNCRWDNVIPLDAMWAALLPKVKARAAMVFTANQPFASHLIVSNTKQFRCEWIYQKRTATGFLNAKKHPMKAHESVLMFAKKAANYYPIKEARVGKTNRKGRIKSHRKYRKDFAYAQITKDSNPMTKDRHPTTVQEFINATNERGYHPTQKPIALCEYFIKTYSREGETVLDFTMGSGSTGVACINTNRTFIGIEKDDEYFQIANERINARAKNGD